MTPRTQTRPLDDPQLWRRLVARAHPDAGGDHELFIFAGAVKAVVCRDPGELPRPEGRRSPSPPQDDVARVPYPTGGSAGTALDFEEITRRALSVEGPYSPVLARLTSCYPLPHLAYDTKSDCTIGYYAKDYKA
jgi:hypothetical protein